MLRYRIPAALVISGVFFLCMWMDFQHATSYCLSGFIAIGSVIVLLEFYRMVEVKGIRPMKFFGVVMCLGLLYAHDRWCWEKWHDAPRSMPDLMSTMLTLAVLGTFALQGVRKERIEGAILGIGSTLLGLIYVWFLPAFLIKIRHLGVPGDIGASHGWASAGVELVLVTIFVSKMSDIGGFFVGKTLGRHKLAPQISPKKTWEGLLGGVAASVAMILAWRGASDVSVLTVWPGWVVAILGAILAVASLLGDLIESIFKRDSDVKDAGTIVPGFGGFLDLVDSLMVSSPIAYFFFLFIGARPGV